MSTEDYWYYSIVVGNVRTESETDQFLCVVQQLEEGQERHRVDKRSLSDPTIKEAALRNAVASTVNFMRLRGDVNGVHSQLLGRLTGLPFSSTQEWIDWFDAHQERLRLSPDGQRLIALPE